MVDSESIDVTPQFQRRERWDSLKQSALIESFLLNIPVPPVYLSEDEFGSYSVIDGKQRITSVQKFMRNALPLKSLERFPELEGLRFRDMPSALKNALTVRPYIRAITILNQSDKATKYEVFHRLNSGGEPLNPQEIRNVIYRGVVNDAIVKASNEPFLRTKLKIKDGRSSAYQKMADVEYVLRFLTLRATGFRAFGGDFRFAMDKFMEDTAEATIDQTEEFESAFRFALHSCERIWGDAAFKRPEKSSWRDQTLAGMYDAQMLAVDQLSKSVIDKAVVSRDLVVARTRALFDDAEFEDSVRVATNTPAKLIYRVNSVRDLLETI